VEGLDTALIAAIAASLVVRGLELREMRRYSFGTGCKRGVPAADVPVDVDGDLAGQGLRSRGRARTDLATRSPGLVSHGGAAVVATPSLLFRRGRPIHYPIYSVRIMRLGAVGADRT
jgi:hypothetical protein